MLVHPVAFRLRHSQQPADHNPEPSSHTDRLFQHLSPWQLCKIQLKITNLEKQSMNEACGFVGAEPSLAPSWFWVPCSVAVTLQSWASVTSLNKAPLSQISSFATWNAAELLLTQGHSWEHLPLGSNKWLPDHGLKFPGNRTAVFSFSDSKLVLLYMWEGNRHT